MVRKRKYNGKIVFKKNFKDPIFKFKVWTSEVVE